MKVYFDTNIYLDFFEDRNDGLRPLGEYAFNCFKRGIECEFYIVFSEHVLDELIDFGISNEDLDELFDWIGIKLLMVDKCKNDYREVKNIMRKHNIHYKDALHHVIAQRTSDRLLTNDNELKLLPDSTGYETF
ncbi:MAG: PIN domain-containing protein [archaeon]